MSNQHVHSSKGSILPSVAGCFLLFNAMSVFLGMYRAYLVRHSATALLIPESRLAPSSQWLWLAAGAIGNVLAGSGLLRRRKWARELLIGLIFLNGGINALTSTASVVTVLWILAASCVPLLILMASRGDAKAFDLERSQSPETPRRMAGRALFGFSAFVMFVTLTSLFNGQTPAHATQSQAGVGLFIMAGLSIMLVGGAIMGPVTLAIREIGLVLVSLASYLVFFCIWSYVTLRLHFPRNPWHFVWDETLLWLIILGIGGFVLLGLSERRRPV